MKVLNDTLTEMDVFVIITVFVGILLLLRYRKRVDARDSYKSLRKIFLDHPLPIKKKGKDGGVNCHTHPAAATARAEADTFINSCIYSAGFRPYSVSASARDVFFGFEHSRRYYFPKDRQYKAHVDNIRSDHILKMVDVDYYLDINSYLRGNPVMLYTFAPHAPAGHTADTVWTVLEDRVHLSVSGGAKYEHYLWDYDVDHVVVSTPFRDYYYWVDLKRPDDDHAIVMFTPMCVDSRWFPCMRFGHAGIARVRFTYGNINYACRYLGSCVYHYISMVGSYSAAKISDASWITANIKCARSKTPLLAEVERIFRADEGMTDTALAASLFITALGKVPNHSYVFTPPRTLDDVHYQTDYPLVLEDGKSSMRVLTKAFISGAEVPAKSLNNDVSCVQGRLADVANSVTYIPDCFWVWAHEFVTGLAGSGYNVPDSYDTIIEGLRPSQRTKLDRVKEFLDVPASFVASFQKAEAYAKITHPRNISNVSPGHVGRFLCFVKPLVRHLKQFEWYAPGMDPNAVALRIRKLADSTNQLVETDYSRLDGSAGHFHHALQRMLFLSFYPPIYHEEINELFNMNLNARAATSYGVEYEPLWSVLSGGANTSLSGTLISSSVEYIARRMGGSKHSEAFGSLGLYCGDDGISSANSHELERAAKRLGLRLKCEVKTYGAPISFLARIYENPWIYPDSHADIKRVLAKLHLGVFNDTAPQLVLLRRALALKITDPLTPIVSSIAEAIIRLVPLPQGRAHERWLETTWAEAPYNYRDFEHFRFDYPLCPTHRDLAMVNFSTSNGLDISCIEKYEQHFRDCKNWSELINFDTLQMPEVKPEVTVSKGDDLLKSDKDSKHTVVVGSKIKLVRDKQVVK